MIACLAVPYFAAAVERRATDTLGQKPLAIGGHPWEAKPIYAFSQEVARQGVKSGMSLRLVQVLSPHSHFIPAHKPQYGCVSAEIVDVLTDFSPQVEPQELWHSFADSDLRLTAHGRFLPARYCLDLDGLPLAEAIPFMQEMGRQVRTETRFAAAIGLSADKFTAQVAATVSRPNRLLPVAPENHAQFLASRPLAFLPLDKESARRLRLMGIGTLGQLATLPLTALREQFGPAIESFCQLARGQAGEPVQPQPATQGEKISRQCDDPIENVLVLTAVLGNMVEEVAQRLQTAALAGRTLQLSVAMADGRWQQKSIPLRQPTADSGHLKNVCQEALAQTVFDCGIVEIQLAVTDLTPATARQLTLLPDTAVAPHLQRTVQNLAARYQNGRFYQPVLAERNHPLPERRFQLRPFAYDPALA